MNPIITTATTAARHLCLHRARCSRGVEDARDWPEDREIDGTLCRRLSPEYFAWLRSRMLTAQAAHKAGKLPEDAWNTLRKRFNALQALAIREFGKELLQEVLHSFSRRTINHRASSRAPGETRRSSQKGLDLSREPSLEM